MSEELSRDVGEIKGLLQGIRELVAAGQEATNRRIDDMQASSVLMHEANTRRLDDLSLSLRERMGQQSEQLAGVEKTANKALTIGTANAEAISTLKRTAQKHGAGAGAGVGVVVEVGFELLKHLFKH